MKINTGEFKKIIKTVYQCVPGVPLVPVLSNICFTDNKIMAYDSNTAVIVNFIHDFNCLVNGEALYKFVNVIDSTDIDIEQKENALVLKAGKSKVSLSTIESKQFVFKMPPEKEGITLKIDGDFINGIKKCLFSVGNNSTSVNQYGITFCNNTLYATDTIKISKYALQQNFDIKDKIFLPKPFCNMLVKLVENQECILTICDKSIYASFDAAIIYTTMFEDINFIDYNAFIVKILTQPDDVWVIEGFKEMVIRCTSMSEDKDLIVDVNIENNILNISSVSLNNTLRYEDSINLPFTFDNTKFKINCAILKHFVSNVIAIGFCNFSNRTVLFGKHGGFTYIISSLFKNENSQ